jgi:hypothetical protein
MSFGIRDAKLPNGLDELRVTSRVIRFGIRSAAKCPYHAYCLYEININRNVKLTLFAVVHNQRLPRPNENTAIASLNSESAFAPSPKWMKPMVPSECAHQELSNEWICQ